MSEKRFKKFGSAEEFNSLLDYSFVNYDGTVLQSGKLVKGETPTYNGETPTRPDSGQYRYDFIGWSPEIHPLRQDQTEFVAQYEKTLNNVTVTIENNNSDFGSIDETSISVPVGATLFIVGNAQGGTIDISKDGQTIAVVHATPNEHTVQYNYLFTGRSINGQTVSGSFTVEGNMTVSAGFMREIMCYDVIFYDEDETTILYQDLVQYGLTPTYGGQTPTKQPTAQYEYTFNGWSPALGPVSSRQEYHATYTQAVRNYTVSYIDQGNTEIYSEIVAYGSMPTKYDSINENYGMELDEYTELKLYPDASPIVENTSYKLSLRQIPMETIRQTNNGRVEYFPTKGYYKLISQQSGVIRIADRDENGGDEGGVPGQPILFGGGVRDTWLLKEYTPRQGYYIPEAEDWYIFSKIAGEIYQGYTYELALDLNLYRVTDPQAKEQGLPVRYRAGVVYDGYWSRTLSKNSNSDRSCGVLFGDPDSSQWNIQNFAWEGSSSQTRNLRLFRNPYLGASEDYVIPVQILSSIDGNIPGTFSEPLVKIPNWTVASFTLQGYNISNWYQTLKYIMRMPVTYCKPISVFVGRPSDIQQRLYEMKYNGRDRLDYGMYIHEEFGLTMLFGLPTLSEYPDSWFAIAHYLASNMSYDLLFKQAKTGSWDQTLLDVNLTITIYRKYGIVEFSGWVDVNPQWGNPFSDYFQDTLTFNEIDMYVPDFSKLIMSSDYVYLFLPQFQTPNNAISTLTWEIQ